MSEVAESFDFEPVNAYHVAEGHSIWLVPCKCGLVHVHGAGEGPRTPHCRDKELRKKQWPHSYTLVHAGQATPEMIHAVYGDYMRTKAFEKQIASETARYKFEKKRKKLELEMQLQ